MTMSTALHRTDVGYVWPGALVRPSGAELLYLDQNHWINLAQAAVGTPTGAPFHDALQALREARRSGRVVIPLSLTPGDEHYSATATGGCRDGNGGTLGFRDAHIACRSDAT